MQTIKELLGGRYKGTIAEYWPDADPGIEPFGSRVLVQFKSPRKMSKGGIILVDESKETDKWNTQVGIVRAIGALAFRNRTTNEVWPEGAWCAPGDFVRVAKYGGDRWELEHEGQTVLFVIFNDLEIIGRVTTDPTSLKTFI